MVQWCALATMHLINCSESGFCCVQERQLRLVPAGGGISTSSSLALNLGQMQGSLRSPLQGLSSPATLRARCWRLLMGYLCPQLPLLVAVPCRQGCLPLPSQSSSSCRSHLGR